jgi:hypothetical protein
MVTNGVLVGVFGEIANIFGFYSSKGGVRWWKWCRDGSTCGLECERGGSKLFKILPTRFWVGCLVKMANIFGFCNRRYMRVVAMASSVT